MELFIMGVIVLVAVAYGIFYYWSNRKPAQPAPESVPYKVETPVVYTMDETFGVTVVTSAEEKSAQEPAKMAKPKLKKVDGGAAAKRPKAPKAKASGVKSGKPKKQKSTPKK
jgi:hypothetical protein